MFTDQTTQCQHSQWKTPAHQFVMNTWHKTQDLQDLFHSTPTFIPSIWSRLCLHNLYFKYYLCFILLHIILIPFFICTFALFVYLHCYSVFKSTLQINCIIIIIIKRRFYGKTLLSVLELNGTGSLWVRDIQSDTETFWDQDCGDWSFH